MGYPPLFENSGSCLLGLSSVEAQWLNAMGDLLLENQASLVRTLANSGLPVTFADPRQAYAGKGLCGNPETVWRLVSQKTPGEPSLQPVSTQSFHPKITGHAIFGNVFTATLREVGL